VIDLKVVFLLLCVLSGGKHSLTCSLYSVVHSFQIFCNFLCSSHAALQIQADLTYKDCRYSEDTDHGYLGLAIQSNGVTTHLKSRKGLNGSPFSIHQNIFTSHPHLHFEFRKQLLANGAGET
jgi:hypothetical protein